MTDEQSECSSDRGGSGTCAQRIRYCVVILGKTVLEASDRSQFCIGFANWCDVTPRHEEIRLRARRVYSDGNAQNVLLTRLCHVETGCLITHRPHALNLLFPVSVLGSSLSSWPPRTKAQTSPFVTFLSPCLFPGPQPGSPPSEVISPTSISGPSTLFSLLSP